jgi:ABC-type lipoprotein export system ATPase subunit
VSVQVHHLRKEYAQPRGARRTILDIPQLTLSAGDQVALTGPSGAGKSTLLHLLAGTLLPEAGSLIHDWDGTPVDFCTLTESARDRYRGRYIGCVFQGHHLLPALSARDNVLLGLQVTGRVVDAAWADHLLDRVGLREQLHHRPHQLSAGQSLRVACARALAARPALLLIDEPTATLDIRSAGVVLESLLGLASEIHAGVLVITHDAEVAKRIGTVVELETINQVRPC